MGRARFRVSVSVVSMWGRQTHGRELIRDNRDLGQMEQCIYCLTNALRVDPSDVEALWDLATVHRMLDNKLKVRSTPTLTQSMARHEHA